MKIIVGGTGYPEKRNILTDNSYHYLDHRMRNVWTWMNAIRQRLLRWNKLFLFRPVPFLSPVDADITHLFNEVATGSGNWVATFETELPRVLPVRGIEKFKNPELTRELRYVSSPHCRGIIAISEATRQIQLQLLEHFPTERAAILPKLYVMHPPQPVLQERTAAREEGLLTFTFVGNEFYRKGGAEVVLAFSQLFREGVLSVSNVRVNIVGDTGRTHNLAHGDFQDDTVFRKSIESTLSKIPIFHPFTSLANSAVLELIRSTDVGLLPTWQDTYGFSVLEMQACACPVISTNVRALPEINPDEAGWMIHCPLNKSLEISVKSSGEKEHLRNIIIEQLKAFVVNIMNNRELLQKKSAGAISRIRTEHDPVLFQQRLNAIYRGEITES
ncbi:glycosyl transferase [Pantoea rodasii]|uniref:Glycosyl transferase n=1 Tax=Pantoea rodasii TaxID=1076549 RepID=A0A2M9W9B3_9GAMM|nr:glycosyltransferase family 4 protein [Pantoea rodasii]PJZ04068.1 glycosyl transferase [Pantoea rodasii]